MAINYLNITRYELPANPFKYMKLERAVDSIRNGTLWFANLKECRGPYESYFMNNAYDIASDSFEFPLENKFYACCFSALPNSEAQWNEYTSGLGIMCQLSTDEFLEDLDKHSSDYD